LRVILDTNILVSALLVRGTPPDELYEAWRDGHFDLVSCKRQLEEMRRVSHRPFFAARLKRSEVGRMINAIRRLALMREPVADLAVSLDPNDDFLPAMAEAADADFLVTGDKSGLLELERHGRTRIVTARALADMIGRRRDRPRGRR
jgi:putative PIN family toxin of toxin-antitoxin system